MKQASKKVICVKTKDAQHHPSTHRDETPLGDNLLVSMQRIKFAAPNPNLEMPSMELTFGVFLSVAKMVRLFQ